MSNNITGSTNVEVSRSRDINRIIVPEGMPLQDAARWCIAQAEAEERKVAINEPIAAFPLDGAYALHRAMKEIFGWIDLVATPGFFGPTPPTMVQLDISATETVRVPWGRMVLPMLAGGYIQTTVTRLNGRPAFQISGEVKKKHEGLVVQLVDRVRELIKHESIYKGKAFRIAFPATDDPEAFDFSLHTPRFLPLTGITEEQLIFPPDVYDLIATTLWTPIEYATVAKRAGVRTKRGVLLSGRPGVGKTLTAYVTAKKAVDNGWTFIYLEDVNRLADAVNFAAPYGPTVIFAEDIDRADKLGERNDAMNAILNVIDGIESKHGEVFVVLTTNFLEKLPVELLRPGRLDAVVDIPAPDATTVVRLLRKTCGSLLPDSENIDAVGHKLAETIPAVIAEVTERAKLSSVRRLALAGTPDAPLNLTAHDLSVAADSITTHLRLLEPKAPVERSSIEKGAQLVADGLIRAAQLMPRE